MITHQHFKISIFFCILLLATTEYCWAIQEKDLTKKHKKTPLLVTVEEVVEGSSQPMADFIGTTYYSRISHVASNSEGLVAQVHFDVGEKIEEGATLVSLDTEILDIDITGTRAEYEQNIIDLKNAEKDFKRIEALYKKQSISETQYDASLSKQKRLEKQSIIVESKLHKLLIIKRKKNISAPFTGIIIKKSSEVGEWLPKGGKVAVVADNAHIDVLVEVPIQMLDYLNKESPIRLIIRDKEHTATFFTFVPRGDVATRTITTTFRLASSAGLLEGMEALLRLPSGPRANGFLIPRDAVVDKYGKTMVFLASDKTAQKVPIKVAGFVGLQAVVIGEGLEKGRKIIVQGSKRVIDGQQIQFKGTLKN